MNELNLPSSSFIEISSITNTKVIGRGAYGIVYKGLYKNEDIVYKTASSNGKQALINEIKLLERLNHPNIIKYIGWGYNNESDVCLVLEFVAEGSLDVILKKCGKLSDKICKGIIYQLLLSLEYIHNFGIVHRDIKPENILVTKNGVVKLGDFGVSKQLLENVRQRKLTDPYRTGRGSMAGTRSYMSPEILTLSNKTNNQYSSKLDVWSVGCTMYTLLTGKIPIGIENNKLFGLINSDGSLRKDYKNGMEVFLSKDLTKTNLSNNAISFISDCLTINPYDRPNVMKLLEHVYLSDVKFPDNEFLYWLITCKRKNDNMRINLNQEYYDITQSLPNNLDGESNLFESDSESGSESSIGSDSIGSEKESESSLGSESIFQRQSTV